MARRIARVRTADRDLSQVQENILTVVQPALDSGLAVVSSTTDKTGATLQGYLEVDSPLGRVWLPYYTRPTGP